jgi:hypothetical protein
MPAWIAGVYISAEIELKVTHDRIADRKPTDIKVIDAIRAKPSDTAFAVGGNTISQQHGQS